MAVAKALTFAVLHLALAAAAVYAFKLFVIDDGSMERHEARMAKMNITGPIERTVRPLSELIAHIADTPAGSMLIQVFFTLPGAHQLVDFQRSNVHLIALPLYPYFYQFWGISIFAPLALAYYSFVRYRSSPSYNGVSASRLVIACLVTFVPSVLFIAVPITARPSDACHCVLAVALLAPVVLPLLLFVVGKGPTPSKQNSFLTRRALVVLYSAVAGLSCLVYWTGLVKCVLAYSTVSEFLADIAKSDAGNFILADFVIYYAAELLFIWSESGLSSAVLCLVLSAVLGPGAGQSICLVHREWQLGSQDDALLKTDQQKKAK